MFFSSSSMDYIMTKIEELKLELDELCFQLNDAYNKTSLAVEKLLYDMAIREGSTACEGPDNYPRMINARKFMLEALTGIEQ
jgi:hypothetical protein